jgi:hypothetical protein
MMRISALAVCTALLLGAACATSRQESTTARATASPAHAAAQAAAQPAEISTLCQSWDESIGKRVRLRGTYDTWGSIANALDVKDHAMVDVKSKDDEIRCWLGPRTEEMDTMFETYEPGKTEVVGEGTVDKEHYFLTQCKLERSK